MQRNEKERSTGADGEKKRFFERVKGLLAEKDESEVRTRLKNTVSFLLVAAATYLLGSVELFFGTFPLCVALAASERRRLLPIGAGYLLLLISGKVSVIYILVAVAILLMRVLVFLMPRVLPAEGTGNSLIKCDEKALESVKEEKKSGARGLFLESLLTRVLSAAIGGFICGLVRLIESSFSIYSMFACFFLVISSPLAVLIFGGLFGGERERTGWYYLASVGAVFFFSALSALDKTFLGMPMAPFLAMLLTLFVCSRRGVWLGVAVAVLCGLSLELIYLPLLVLVAVLFCLVSSVKRNMGLPAVCALVVVWCYYIGGERGLISYLAPMLLAIPFYYLADKYCEMMSSPYLRERLAESGIFFAEAVTEKTKNEVAYDRLDALSGAFSSLSETFYKLSDRFRRPDVLGIKRIAEGAFETHCEGCRNREICWGSDYDRTLDAIKRVSSELHKKGGATVESLGKDFISTCPRCEMIIDEVNGMLSKTTEKVIRDGKANIFSANYDDITALLKDALESDSEEYESDIELGGKVFDLLLEAGLRPRGVVVYGKRCRHVVARGVVGADKISPERIAKLRDEVSKIVGVELGEPCFEVGKDGNVMIMHSRPAIRAHCAHGKSASGKKVTGGADEGEEIDTSQLFSEDVDDVCGDTTGAFITDMSFFYSLISDGMGSGSEAAFTSNVCAMFIEKMLSAGNRADITLRMLNNVIRSENLGLGSECSATVDLFELDLMSGAASFIKSGAAPTYVARGGTVYKISSRTMPVGIIKDADARITRFDTEKGDLIVMMSDGCCPDSDDCTWLVEYLCAYAKKSARAKAVEIGENKDELCCRLRDEILDEAVKNYPADRSLDDISVSVVLID